MIVHVPRQAKRPANLMVPLKHPERSKYGDRPDLEHEDQGTRTKVFTANRVRKLRLAAKQREDEEIKLVVSVTLVFFCRQQSERARLDKKKILMREKRAEIKNNDPERWRTILEANKQRYFWL